MKEIGKLWRTTRHFYLVVLVIVLLLNVLNCIYLCNYTGIAFNGTGIENTIIKQLESEPARSVTPINLSGFVMDEIGDMTLMGQLGTGILIVSLLFARYFAYADGRTREMQMMWPIRRRTRVFFDYVAMFVILLIGWITQVGILLGRGSYYNHVAVRVLSERGMDTSAFFDAAIISEYKMYVVLMGTYLLYQILFYTFLFLGMIAAKNPLFGFVACFIWWAMFGLLAEEMLYSSLFYEETVSGIFASEEITAPGACLMGIQQLLYYPDEVYGQINAFGLFPKEAYEAYPGGISGICAIQTLLWAIFVMIFMIACISKRKELAKGRFMYSKGAEIRLTVCFGFLIYLYGRYMGEAVTPVWGIILIVVVLGIYLFFKKKRVQKNWEVK